MTYTNQISLVAGLLFTFVFLATTGLAQEARFEVALFDSPRGTKANSLGRKPQESRRTNPKPQRGDTQRIVDDSAAPPGLGGSYDPISWGFRPRLLSSAALRLFFAGTTEVDLAWQH